MVRQRTLSDVRLFDKRMAPGESYPSHVHDGAVITLVLSGSYAEAFERCEHACRSWSVQYKPAGIEHTTACGGSGVRMAIVEVHPRLAGALGLTEQETPALLDCGVPSAVAATIFALAFGRGPERHLQAALDRLIGTVTERLSALAGPEPPGWILEARDSIRDIRRPAPTLATLAAARGVHPVHLARVFRRHFGCSAGTYLRRCRTDRAVRELIGSDVPLATLACRLGYHDQSHMTREFTREVGVPPQRFRRLTAATGD